MLRLEGRVAALEARLTSTGGSEGAGDTLLPARIGAHFMYQTQLMHSAQNAIRGLITYDRGKIKNVLN